MHRPPALALSRCLPMFRRIPSRSRRHLPRRGKQLLGGSHSARPKPKSDRRRGSEEVDRAPKWTRWLAFGRRLHDNKAELTISLIGISTFSVGLPLQDLTRWESEEHDVAARTQCCGWLIHAHVRKGYLSRVGTITQQL